MENKLLKELPVLTVVIIPFIYLGYLWNGLPDTVPIHWNIHGEIDGWGSKSTLLWLPFLLPFLTYLIFLVVPKIDPKNKINKMGPKYDQFKFFTVLFMSIITMLIFYATKHSTILHPNLIFVILGLFFVVIGNYLPSIKANYFIGIRTPWTLESEIVWKKTHQLAGKLWVVGGILMSMSSLLIPSKYNFAIFMTLALTMAMIPLLYSYFIFKEKENNSTN